MNPLIVYCIMDSHLILSFALRAIPLKMGAQSAF